MCNDGSNLALKNTCSYKFCFHNVQSSLDLGPPSQTIDGAPGFVRSYFGGSYLNINKLFAYFCIIGSVITDTFEHFNKFFKYLLL